MLFTLSLIPLRFVEVPNSFRFPSRVAGGIESDVFDYTVTRNFSTFAFELVCWWRCEHGDNHRQIGNIHAAERNCTSLFCGCSVLDFHLIELVLSHSTTGSHPQTMTKKASLSFLSPPPRPPLPQARLHLVLKMNELDDWMR
jgi:hypothetical protein